VTKEAVFAKAGAFFVWTPISVKLTQAV